MSLQALVYADRGVCVPSADALVQQLKAVLDPAIAVLKVDAHYLKTQPWEDKTVVLGMAGGACRDWDEQLQAEGIKRIHEYVSRKGKFIGLCAGAYFASAQSLFHLGNQSIEKKRALGFFPGKAIGPLIDCEDYLSLSAARAAPVAFKMRESLESGALYYQGGCLFDVQESSESVEIMATYQGLERSVRRNPDPLGSGQDELSPLERKAALDAPLPQTDEESAPLQGGVFQKAAAVFCRVGEGSAFLFGPHPEFQWSATLSTMPGSMYHELVENLSAQERFRQKIWEEIVTKLELPRARREFVL